MIIILICICIYIISCIYIYNYAYVCICILRERESSDNVGLDLVSRRVASVTRSGSDFPFMVCQKSSPRCNLSCTPHIISQQWPQQNLRVSATLGQNVAQFHDPCIIINASPCIINYHASTCVLRSPCTMPDPAWRNSSTLSKPNQRQRSDGTLYLTAGSKTPCQNTSCIAQTCAFSFAPSHANTTKPVGTQQRMRSTTLKLFVVELAHRRTCPKQHQAQHGTASQVITSAVPEMYGKYTIVIIWKYIR